MGANVSSSYLLFLKYHQNVSAANAEGFLLPFALLAF